MIAIQPSKPAAVKTQSAKPSGLLSADPLSERGDGPPLVSFEFFPPKTDEMEEKLWQTIKRLEWLTPRFVSVTAGAGGTKREGTPSPVARIRSETRTEPARQVDSVGARPSAALPVPTVPGKLPVTNVAQVKKFAAQCGAAVPHWMATQFEGLDDDPETRRLVATSIAAEQCRLLQANGVHEFHFYTL